MIKQVRSWRKDSDIPGLIAEKKVDASIFVNGSHIPNEFHEDFQEANQGHMPVLGTSQKVLLHVDGQSFEARLQLINQKSANREALHLRYDSNKELKQLLISRFQASYRYITTEKQQYAEKKNIIVPDDQAEYISFYETGVPFEYRMEFVTRPTQPQVWWVNQGATYTRERDHGILWAPLRTKNGRAIHHWETMKDVRQGDIVLHYANKAIRAVSQVTEQAVLSPKPTVLADSDWEEEGRLIHTQYVELKPEIPLQQFNQQVLKLNLKQGPIHSGGGVNQGYLFRFSIVGLQLIQEASKIDWPSFTRFEEHASARVEVDVIAEMADEEVKPVVQHIQNFIQQKGFTFPDMLIENYYLSLKTKPFVILAGISGTGKTRLVRLFAEALGATADNGQFTLIPVRPDWSDPSDLLGYKDLTGKFNPGTLTNVFVTASLPENQHKSFFVCLDEMNLARVEHYFSDLLSLLESHVWKDGKMVTDTVIPFPSLELEDDLERYGDLTIPNNVYIVGTVNMDETTHPFSKKVLDRANTLEFNDIQLNQFPWSEDATVAVDELSAVNHSFLRNEYINLIDVEPEYKDLIVRTTEKLEKINRILEGLHAHVGFRVRDTICFYLIYNQRFGLMSEKSAFDIQLLQKILPRLQGSQMSLKRVLLKLLQVALSQSLNISEYMEDSSELYFRWDSDQAPPDAVYPQTARKLTYMLRRLEEDGFTSYWLS